MIKHVHVQLALSGQSGQGEVAAAEIADDGIDRVRAEEQVEFGVQGVLDEQFDDDFLRLDLTGQASQALFILIGRCADAELVAELLRQRLLQTERRSVVHASRCCSEAQGGAKVFRRERLHADQQAAAVAVAAGPFLHVIMELTPPAKVEIADAEIRAPAEPQRFL